VVAGSNPAGVAISAGFSAITTTLFLRLTRHCEIVETGKESWRFKNRA
jgi:hypothetical protein